MSEPARDPGLQPERTGLAWSRTAFVMLLISALLLRGGIAHHEHGMAGAGLVLLVATGATYAWAGWRLRMTITSATTNAPPVTRTTIWAMRATALVVALVGVSLMVSVLYHGALLDHLRALLS